MTGSLQLCLREASLPSNFVTSMNTSLFSVDANHQEISYALLNAGYRNTSWVWSSSPMQALYILHKCPSRHLHRAVSLFAKPRTGNTYGTHVFPLLRNKRRLRLQLSKARIDESLLRGCFENYRGAVDVRRKVHCMAIP